MTIQYKGRWQWDWRERRADVALNASVPWDIEVVGGSNKLQGKLATVDLRLVRADRRRRPAPARRSAGRSAWCRSGSSAVRTTPGSSGRPGATSSCSFGRHRRRRVRRPEARRDGRPDHARVAGRGRRERSLRDRGRRGANRIAVVEVGEGPGLTRASALLAAGQRDRLARDVGVRVGAQPDDERGEVVGRRQPP